MEKKIVFPEDFWWGSAWSAEQSEGTGDTGKAETIWKRWFSEEPNRFYDRIGPDVTTDHFNRYKDDIRLMKETGHNSFRLSLSWARLFPDGGRGEINRKAVDFYRDLMSEMIKNDIKPFINLYHFDMPMKLQELGGWASRETVEAYVNYAVSCF